MLCNFFAREEQFVRQPEGQTLVEYDLLLGLIAVVCVAAVTLLGSNINTMMTTLAGDI